jgi:GDP-L-fucose synthase
MDQDTKIYVAGHRGMVGSAIRRRLEADGIRPILRTRAELDLTDRSAVEAFFAQERPDFVFLAAAKVGGILANDQFGGDFIRERFQVLYRDDML